MRPFCQVIVVADRFAVIAPSPFTTVAGACLQVLENRYQAECLARQVNALARVYRRPRASAAKGDE